MNKKITREEILNMPAGREMDALIAEKVMGIVLRHISDYGVTFSYFENGVWVQYGGCKCCGRAARPNEYCFRAAKHYSEDISAAWEMVEKLTEEGYQFDVEYLPRKYWPDEMDERPKNTRWQADFCSVPGTDMCHHIQSADTAPLAICRAALLAVMETE